MTFTDAFASHLIVSLDTGFENEAQNYAVKLQGQFWCQVVTRGIGCRLGSFFLLTSLSSPALEDNQAASIAVLLNVCGCSLTWSERDLHCDLPNAPYLSSIYLTDFCIYDGVLDIGHRKWDNLGRDLRTGRLFLTAFITPDLIPKWAIKRVLGIC